MTAKRDFKRRVRERQARTGERYTTARAHLLGPRAEPIPVTEMVDLTDDAARLGFRCDVRMFPSLAGRIDPAAALAGLRDALLATAGDPATARMIAIALRGERPALVPWSSDHLDAVLRFLARARAGIAGSSEGGHLLAFRVDAETLIGGLWEMGLPFARVAPRLILSTADALVAEYDSWGILPRV